VQEYKLVKTEDIPVLGASTKDNSGSNEEIFSPSIVKANAMNILGFLKKSCVKEGGTYWIFKDTDKNLIQLYDITGDEAEPEEKEPEESK
jgi:hypothetical protein